MAAPAHLNALRAFEAAARHRSFADAAAELNVTPAAVGQQVRTLEQALGVPLFNRAAGGRTRLVATAAAERALPDIRAGFDRLAAGVARLREAASPGTLTITVSPAFAAKWLLPRIERFHAAHPDIDVRLDTSLKLQDFAAQGIDVGVRYGAGSWAGLTAVRLMDEEVFPVCSPAFLARHRLRVPRDLEGVTLVHDLSVDASAGFASWDAWLARAGIPGAATRRGMRINDSAAVLQAAVDGHGVALARSVLAGDDVASGRLVRLFPKIRYRAALAYFVVFRAEAEAMPKLRAFRAWIADEASPKAAAARSRPARA